MRLDQLALPLGVEQIHEALRRLIWLHQIAVVPDRDQPGADGRVETVPVDLIRRKMFGHVFADIGHEPAVALPGQIVCGIGRGDDVDGVDVAALLLTDALKYALRPRSLDEHGDAWIFLLK